MESIKKFFNGNQSVRGASIVLIITLTLSNLLGLIRDHFLAQKIPTGLLDTYYAGFRLPDLIFNLLILGAISAAFIPVFTSYMSKKEDKEAWEVANSFLNLAFLALIISAVILGLLMPYLIPLLVAKFDPDKQALTLKIARLMLLSPIFFGLSYIFGGILNSFKRFVVYSLAPLIYNLSIIVSTLLFSNSIGIWAPVYGVVAGAFLHLLIQVPTAVTLGWRPRMIFSWAHAGVKKIFRLMIPRSIGLGANQLMLLVYTAIASSLGAGSVAVFNLSDNIQTMPTVVFGTSLATASFPTLSEVAALDKKADFTQYLFRGIRAILFVLIPMGAGIILLRAQIVRLILGSGYFGWQQTIDTANTLGWFAIALFAQGLVPILARAFYAMQDTKTPTMVSIFSIAISIILGFTLAPKMGVAGLALAFSVGGFGNATALYLFLRKKITPIKEEENLLVNFLLKVVISTLVMGALIQLTKYFLGSWVDMTRFWGVLTQTIGAVVLGTAAYLLMVGIFRLKEIKEVVAVFKSRFSCK